MQRTRRGMTPLTLPAPAPAAASTPSATPAAPPAPRPLLDQVRQPRPLPLVQRVVHLGAGAHEGLAQLLQRAVVAGEQLTEHHRVEARLAERVGHVGPGPARLPAQLVRRLVQ